MKPEVSGVQMQYHILTNPYTAPTYHMFDHLKNIWKERKWKQKQKDKFVFRSKSPEQLLELNPWLFPSFQATVCFVHFYVPPELNSDFLW